MKKKKIEKNKIKLKKKLKKKHFYLFNFYVPWKLANYLMKLIL